jgi:hypothetical protein
VRHCLAGLLGLSALVVGACSFLPAGQHDPPKLCNQEYSEDQCLAMVDVAAAEVGKNRSDVVAIAIVPDPPPEGAVLGGAWPIHVRIALKDGSTHDTRMCGGVSIDPACKAEPNLQPRSVIAAYTDVPCGADPDRPEECATRPPTPAPDVIAEARPVELETFAIPIDHLGTYVVPLGEGSLPNGILTKASFEFAEAWPDDLALEEGRAMLDVISLEPDGKPFDNLYAHAWRPGLERVRATLTFDVLWFAPGATLEIRNVVVR